MKKGGMTLIQMDQGRPWHPDPPIRPKSAALHIPALLPLLLPAAPLPDASWTPDGSKNSHLNVHYNHTNGTDPLTTAGPRWLELSKEKNQHREGFDRGR